MTKAQDKQGLDPYVERYCTHKNMNIINFPPLSFNADVARQVNGLPGEKRGELFDDEGGWTPAGLLGTEGNLAIVSRLTGTLIEFNPERFTERATLLSLGPRAVSDYSNYDDRVKRDVFRGSWLAETMQEECRKLGVLKPELVRGPGVYRDGDSLIVNTGKRVFRHNGLAVDLTPKPGGYIYVAGEDIGIDPASRFANGEDLQAFVDALKSFNYARPHDYRLIAGWVVMVTLAQALGTRPSVQLSADRACGKTTMITLLSQVLGSQLVVREGVPTKAQVLYDMQGRCAALAIDECEPSGGGSKAIDAVAELARTGFTGGKSSGYTRIIGGKSRRFNAPTGVLFAAIALPALNPATESRTVRVDLLPLAAKQPGGASRSWLFDPSRSEDVEALGRRLRSLIVLRWPVIKNAYGRLVAMLDAIGHDRRQSAKFATLLACWAGLTNKRAPIDADLRTLVAEHGLGTTAEQQEESEGFACIEHLLKQHITVHRLAAEKSRREAMSIRAVIAAVADNKTPDSPALARQLHDFGLRVFLDELTDTVTLAVSTSSRDLKLAKLYELTDWARGGWKHVLARLPGAAEGFARVSPAKPTRVVKVPLSAAQLDVRFDASLYPAAA